MRESMKKLLSGNNYKIHTGRDGKEAIELLSRMNADIILLDITMPRMNGFQVMDYIAGQGLNTAVIAITGDASVESSIEALKKGAYDYLTKPFEPEKLLKTISNALDYKKSKMELKKSQEALKENEKKYRNIINNMKDGYFRSSLDGNLVMASPSSAHILGYNSVEEVIGKNLAKHFYFRPEDRELLLKAIKSKGEITNYEITLKHKNGKPVIVECNSYCIYDEGKTLIGIEGIFRNITNRRQLETQLQVAQKMEAISTLAGGIAHQFNNALSPISVNLDLLEMDYPDDKKIAGYTGQMKDSAKRMALLSNQLLAYARGGKIQERTLSLSELVRNTLPLIRHTVDPAIQINTDLPDDIFHVKVDLTQIQMVLSAILTNASEAIEDKGSIRITCGNWTIMDETTTGFPHIKPGDYVKLMIEDNGKGMDEETRNRIFEPFFTTKFQGRGLGMAAVYGIIKNHDGWTFIDSELDKGTTVHIYLPAIEAPVERIKKSNIESIVTKGAGTILLIEDEEIVMAVHRALLERIGYSVLGAKTGKEAIEIAKTFEGNIDLAILDIILPDMNGNIIYPLLMEARPNLKVIICSGYSLEGPSQKILDEGAEDFIQKPFSIIEMSEKIKNILEGKEGQL